LSGFLNRGGSAIYAGYLKAKLSQEECIPARPATEINRPARFYATALNKFGEVLVGSFLIRGLPITIHQILDQFHQMISFLTLLEGSSRI
jgi:hypothetical protein